MIHAPSIRVTCDGPQCDPVTLYFPYNQTYAWLFQQLTAQGWIVRDGHLFCCQVCADAHVEPPVTLSTMPLGKE